MSCRRSGLFTLRCDAPQVRKGSVLLSWSSPYGRHLQSKAPRRAVGEIASLARLRRETSPTSVAPHRIRYDQTPDRQAFLPDGDENSGKLLLVHGSR